MYVLADHYNVQMYCTHICTDAHTYVQMYCTHVCTLTLMSICVLGPADKVFAFWF